MNIWIYKTMASSLLKKYYYQNWCEIYSLNLNASKSKIPNYNIIGFSNYLNKEKSSILEFVNFYIYNNNAILAYGSFSIEYSVSSIF